jgi:hypothetical protein
MEDHDTSLFCSKYVRFMIINPRWCHVQKVSQLHSSWRTMTPLSVEISMRATCSSHLWRLVSSMHFYGGPWHILRSKIIQEQWAHVTIRRSVSSISIWRTMTFFPFEIMTRTRWKSVPYNKEHQDISSVQSSEATLRTTCIWERAYLVCTIAMWRTTFFFVMRYFFSVKKVTLFCLVTFFVIVAQI